MMRVVKLPVVVWPEGWEERLELPKDWLAYSVNWTPWGDEVEVYYVTSSGLRCHEVGCADWTAWRELLDLNPMLREFDLGSSDEEPKHSLVVVRGVGAFIVPYAMVEEFILEALAQSGREVRA